MKKIVIAAVLPLIINIAVLAAQRDIAMLTEDYPPLNYIENKKLLGPSVDTVLAVKQKLGVKNNIKVYP